MLRIDLTPISALPGVVYALLVWSGQAIAAAGNFPSDAAIQAVLSEALFSAANELGARSGSGDCLEVAATYADCGFILFGHPSGCQLLVRCDSAIDLHQLRPMAHALLQQAAVVPVEPPPAQRRPIGMPLADALNPSAP